MANFFTHNLNANTTVKGLILLTLPLSLARLVPELNFLFNSVFLGHLGTRELAYAALTGVYYLIFTAIGIGLSNSILSMISRQAGENNRQEILNTLKHGFLIAFTLSATAIVFTFFFNPSVLRFVGVNETDTLVVCKFLNIRIFGLIFILGFQLCNSFLICIRETKWILVASIVEALVNIFFDYIFIFGGLGINAMGINGAAYASVLSEIIGLFTMIAVIALNKFSIKYEIPNRFNFQIQLLKKVLYQALPLMGQYALSIIAWWFFYLLINKNYTYEEQAASQTMRNLFGISGVFSWAFGATTNTVLSNLLGQGKKDEFKPTLFRILKISCIGMLFFVLIINCFPYQIFSIFGQGKIFGSAGISLLRVVSSAMLLLTISVMWLNAVVSTGNTKFVLFIELMSTVFYSTYVYFVIHRFHLDISVAWMSEWIYWSVILIMSYWYINKKFLHVNNISIK